MNTSVEDAAPRCPVVHGEAFDPRVPHQAGDPYPWLVEAQREAPVFWLDAYEMWCVTRHADVLDVLRDTETYSSRKVLDFSKVAPNFYEAFPDGRPDRVLVTLDPPEHTRLRKLAQKGFVPKLVKGWEPEIRELVDSLIDDFVADGHCDLVAQFADRLPVQAITRVLGAPLDRWEEFFEWARDRIVMLQGAPGLSDADRRVVIDRAISFNGWLHEFVEERRAEPREDLASALVNAHGADGEQALDNEEVVALIATILSAGTSTTAHFIPVAVRELLRHPDDWARLRADRSLVPQALEELLRLRSSVRGVVRTTTRDVELGGVAIPADSDIYIHYGAAQHDPEVFADPESFDLDREDVREHFAFGRWAHMCLGAPLARLEVRVTIERLLDRIPDVELAEDAEEEWVPNFLAPGLRELQLRWEV
jgi:cytochrome P450